MVLTDRSTGVRAPDQHLVATVTVSKPQNCIPPEIGAIRIDKDKTTQSTGPILERYVAPYLRGGAAQ